MKRMSALLLIFVLLFSLTACSSNQDNSQETKAADVQKTEAPKTESQADSTEATSESVTQAQANDQNAEGVELLKSVMKNAKKLDSLYAKFKMSSVEVSGVEMAIYRAGESTRTEMNFEGRHTVNIFNEEDGYVYSYAVGEKTGTMMKNSNSEALDEMIPSFSAEQMSEDDFEGLVTARRDKLNGQDVVYMEFQENDDDLGGDVINKIWYSEKYNFFLKMETVKPDSTVAMSIDVLEIEVNKDFSKMMVPPQDVEFVSY